jgi:hypothetical protein
MIYITNKYNSIKLPYEEGLIEWLHANYPHSEYRIVRGNEHVEAYQRRFTQLGRRWRI